MPSRKVLAHTGASEFVGDPQVGRRGRRETERKREKNGKHDKRMKGMGWMLWMACWLLLCESLESVAGCGRVASTLSSSSLAQLLGLQFHNAEVVPFFSCFRRQRVSCVHERPPLSCTHVPLPP